MSVLYGLMRNSRKVGSLKLPLHTFSYLKNILIIFICLIFCTPLLMLLFGSFKTLAEADKVWVIIPKAEWRFENYLEVFQKAPIIRSAANGFFISISSVAIVILTSVMCSFIIGRRKDKVSNFFYILFIGGLTLPVSYIPLIKVLQVLGIANTYLGVILVLSAIGLPFNVFLITGFIRTVPREMDEAAVIDGCKTIELFLRIIVPLLKPVIAVASINIFIFGWNNFMLPLYLLGDPKKWTMPLTIFNFYGQYFRSWNLVFANMVITAVPCLLILLFAQKHLIAGVTAGAVKG